MESIEYAVKALIESVEALPLQRCIELIHHHFRRLASSDFLIPQETWLNAFELSAVAKLLYLHAHGRRSGSVDLASALNAYKNLWSLGESQASYSDAEEQVACFVLRLVYQQLPFTITRERMQQNFARTVALFSGSSEPAQALRKAFETACGVEFGSFLKVAHILHGVFLKYPHLGQLEIERAIEEQFDRSTVTRSLRVLAASRGQFRNFYESFRASEAWEIPYEFNPLLRFPILLHNERYWCPYPELINYAATRGLYFYISDSVGQTFGTLFSDAFEQYVAALCARKFSAAHVLTETDERECGWHGKTNDVTVLIGDSALLIECKNSGLFSLAKRSAHPQDIADDARKNLVNSKHRQGLYQLHDKIKSIKQGELPTSLASKYSGIKKFYPVLLLHDEIQFANRPECLRNILDAELRKHGVNEFNYQIWHIEELESLLELISVDALPTSLDEKFSDESFQTIDLAAYLASKTGLQHLVPHLFMPLGESKALQILRRLAEQDDEHKRTRLSKMG